MARMPTPYLVSGAAPGAESNASEWAGFGAYTFKGHGAFIHGEDVNGKCISAAERDGLWANVWAALWEMEGQHTDVRTDVRGVLQQSLQERMEKQLRAVLHRVFVPDSTQSRQHAQLLQTEEGWASGFGVARMIPEDVELVFEDQKNIQNPARRSLAIRR